jgi:negative elongation factor A
MQQQQQQTIHIQVVQGALQQQMVSTAPQQQQQPQPAVKQLQVPLQLGATQAAPLATSAVSQPLPQFQQIQQQAVQAAQQQKKGLSLTREQMYEAQEMFRTANKVTRPEKALILGFMAGSRDNPCPNLGSIITIKLSEDQEQIAQGDGSTHLMLVETLFQMNYATGEWKRLRKCRPIME